ncbi:hypothetical protein HK098_003623 [Nowakowskiella sp. JEL0407]|nr:hypothetical protein HK098_003623 [Nowakowskiella sp. JEL0407]
MQELIHPLISASNAYSAPGLQLHWPNHNNLPRPLPFNSNSYSSSPALRNESIPILQPYSNISQTQYKKRQRTDDISDQVDMIMDEGDGEFDTTQHAKRAKYEHQHNELALDFEIILQILFLTISVFVAFRVASSDHPPEHVETPLLPRFKIRIPNTPHQPNETHSHEEANHEAAQYEINKILQSLHRARVEQPPQFNQSVVDYEKIQNEVEDQYREANRRLRELHFATRRQFP